jgi:hypothetical protein
LPDSRRAGLFDFNAWDILSVELHFAFHICSYSKNGPYRRAHRLEI